jgi:hypothetical protein
VTTLLDAPAGSALGLIVDPYDPRANSANFHLDGWLATIDAKLLTSPTGRRALTVIDPLLFALVYLRHHLESEETGGITLADCHFEWLSLAREWSIPDTGLRGWRHAFTSPRNSGKSTWWYTLIPIWAAAHGHIEFLATFANGSTQAEMHLQTFRTEAARNDRLREDFPDLCTAVRKPSGRTVADNEGQFQSKSGFVWIARGIDVASLGMKVGKRRPGVIVLDDIEKDEARYSPGEVEKRLGTLIDAIFPLNERAKVVIVGTVTRPGSINHQLVKIATGQIEPGSEEWESVRWISDERIVPHYHPPIINLPDGSRRSCWPQKWPLEYLESIEHTRNYKKNFENNPRAGGGMYWSDEDIRYGVPPNVGVEYLFVDPPVTRGPKADKCGLSVLGYAPGHGGMPTVEQKRMLGDEWDTRMTREEAMEQGVTRLSRVCVMHAEEVSLTGAPLFQRVLELIALRPSIRAVVVETNQGGDLWKETFADLPAGVRLITFTSTIKKEIRIARSLDLYQKFRVTHARSFGVLEDAQTAYPKIEYDDLIDANSTGTLYLLKPRATRKNHTLRQR